jgi:hypothetical protein
MGLPMGMIVEGSVAVLLAVTIGYCIVLNRRLRLLHSDRDSLRRMVMDLVQATDLANSAVKELKSAAVDADATLTARLAEAERFSAEMAGQIDAGTALLDRIARITNAVRAVPVGEPAAPTGGTEKVQSALQQLAMRTRIRGNAA